jgi:type I restriction enzyme S subunit
MAVMPSIDIRPDHWEIVRSILRQHVPDREVRAFGSRVTWTAKEYSDLDLCVMGDAPLNLATTAALDEAFTESDLPFKVDVIDWAVTNERFRQIIEREHVVVQEGKEGSRARKDKRATYEIAELIREGRLIISDGYRAKNKELSTDGIPFARAQNINNGFDFENANRFPEAHLDRVGQKISQPGDVVFTSKGTVGRFAFVRGDTPRFVYSPQLCFWRSLDHDFIFPRWLFYWMQSREFYIQYHGVAGQTDMAEYVSLRDQRSMSISIPILPEQRAIAHILGTLDDKIELNRRMNETLEAMARTLFKSWFVDFDPVRAKMEGRWKRGQSLPGLPAHLYDIFPTSFVPSELGEIPQGWEVIPLPEAIEVNPKRTLQKGEVVPYLDMANMPTRITPCLENGKTVYVDFLKDGQVGRGSTDYIVLRPKPPLPEEFAYCLARSSGLRDFVIQSMTGSSGRQHVSAELLSHYLLVRPAAPVPARFGAIIRPLFVRARAAAKESRTLAVLRDTLLPRLISGELRVQDAEQFLKERGL